MTRHNLCPNPAAGANTTGYSNDVFARVTGITGMPRTTGIQFTGSGFLKTPTGAVSPGQVVTISFYVKNNTATTIAGGRQVFIAYTRSVGGDAFPENFSTAALGVVGNVQRASFTCAPAPADATGIYLVIDSIAASGLGGSGIEFTAFLYEQVGSLDTYFDGESANSSWDGAQFNSTSTFNDVTTVTSDLDIRWRVANLVNNDVDLRWRVANNVNSLLDLRWRVANLLLSDLTIRWRMGDVVPVSASERYLAAQRRMTAGLIADDPTTGQLIPRVRTTTPSGGFTDTDSTPRVAQTFKLSLLAYDQRPTATIAGVERLVDYHLIGPWDMEIEVGDHWYDEEDTHYEVVGFSEGWGYETKAFIFRHVPREANP